MSYLGPLPAGRGDCPRAEGLVEVEGHKGMLGLAPRRLSDRLITEA
jgi:hypothetical protein